MRDPGHDRRARLEAARLYLVCGARPADGDPEPLLRSALAGGVDVVQLREKDASDAELLRAAGVFRRCTADAGALFVLNDRPDLAAACEADGVHVGQDDMPVARARELVGEDLIVGVSTHSEAQIATAAGADYIGVGPVHATPTKPGRPEVGLDLVAHATAHASAPWFAIGGITPANAGAVIAAGATRIAVARAITESEDPAAAARALRAALDREEAGVGTT